MLSVSCDFQANLTIFSKGEHMKRALILAAGSLSAAGAALGAASVISAAPAVADAGCSPDFVCDVLDQPPVFVNGVAAVPQQFTQIVTGQQLAGQLDDLVNEDECITEPGSNNCGLVNQPQAFLDSINPANTVPTFVGSIVGGPQTFVSDLASQPQTFVDSITKPFGPDTGPDTDGTEPE
jgi:hypothetical protein